MKKLLTCISASAIMISALTFTSIAQKDNKNQHKEEKQNKGNKEGKVSKQDKQFKNEKENGQMARKINKQEKQNDNKNDRKLSKWEKKENKAQYKNKNNNGKNEDIASVNNGRKDQDGWGWNDDNFKERKKLRNQEKVTLCHKINNNNEPGVAISVSANAVKAHMKHGDAIGGCPAVQNNSFSNTYLTRRTDYYNTLQKSQEQVLYSQSILEYAVARLTNSRLQLTTLKANNMPAVEIERKQATVTELEQNVSLLGTLIGAATNFVVSKLQ